MSKHLLWVDLEMTGLDENRDAILELAAVITDWDLKTQAELHSIVKQPQSVLDQMDDWCKKTHGDSGLSAAVPKGTPLPEVEDALMKLIDRFFSSKERIVLVGNSIGNDKRFIDRYMPKVAQRLHYRVIDISSFKEVFRDKYGIEFKKKNNHRAVDDIYESIKEMQTYLSYIQVNPGDRS